MPIKDLTDTQLDEILHEHLTPSKEINTPERLLGREHHLRRIARAFNSEGRNVFVHGDRGIGKTSVARTAATVNCSTEAPHIYVPCGENTSFRQVIQAIGHAVLPLAQRVRPEKVAGGATLGLLGATLGGNFSSDKKAVVEEPTTIIDALDILAYVAEVRKHHRTIVVVDEFDRITGDHDKVLFAELIKNLPTRNIDLRFIFCGIGHTVDELLGKHLSVGRYFQPIELEKLHHNHLWDIINAVSDRTNMKIPQEVLYRISIISDGFPHFVHLLGQCMFYAMHDSPEEVTVCSNSHYHVAVKEALDQTEPPLRAAYQRATEKVKNKLEYEEALWALADRAETRRQLKNIYEVSYKRIMQKRSLDKREILSRELLNQRLQALRRPPHGEIVIGTGSGWYSFRENVMRGYVRLKAEAEGIELAPDLP